MNKHLRLIIAVLLLPFILNLACSKSSDPNVVVDQGEEGGGGEGRASAKPVLRATFDSCVGPVEFSGDGKSLAVVAASAGGPIVQLIDVGTNKVRSTLSKKSRLYPTAIGFSRDDKLLATAWEEEVIFWDVATGERKQALKAWAPSLGMVNRLAFSPDGKLLAAIGRNSQMTGEVKIWELASGKEIATLSEDPNVVHDGVFSADSKRLATVGFHKDLGPSQSKLKGTIKVWDIAEKKVLEQYEGPPEGICDPKGVVVAAMQIRFGEDRELEALGRWNETMKTWDVVSGLGLTHFEGRSGFIVSAAFSRDRKLLAGGDKDGNVMIWNGTTGDELFFVKAHDRWTGTLAFNNDATLLATTGGTEPADSKLKIWSLASK